MPRILFIAAHRPGRSPSQRFRFEQYLNMLKENGFDFDFSYLIPEKYDKKFYSQGYYFAKFLVMLNGIFIRIKDILSANRYDIIFVQREAFMTGTTFFEKQFSKSKAQLIFDFDDSIWLSNVSDGNRNLEWIKDYAKTGKIIELADQVIAGNRYLKNYALHFNPNVQIIPTTIDTHYHKRNAASNANKTCVCIGWTGTSTTLRHFKLIIPALNKIRDRFGNSVEFKVIVDTPYDEPSLNIRSTTWNKNTEIGDLSSIDIGIMPLPDDDWARGKCGFKGLQYMALEIPTVMSPVGVNTEIIEEGRNGFLATTENEWVEKLSALVLSKDLRKQIGEEARKTVVEKYSVESQKGNYISLFRKLADQKKVK